MRSFLLVLVFLLVIPSEAIVSEIVHRTVALGDVLRESNAVVLARKEGTAELKVETNYAGFKIGFQLPGARFAVEEVLLSVGELTAGQAIEVVDPGELNMRKISELQKKGVSISKSVARYGARKSFSKLKKGERVILFLAGPRQFPAGQSWDPQKLTSLDGAPAGEKDLRSLWLLSVQDAFETRQKINEIRNRLKASAGE